jgi:O-antigen/teichoic acid export membrane protein
MSAFYKAISGLSLFISIPLLINYLGTANYGVWILVFALFQWVLLMDFGLSSVLKTRIPDLQHSNNTDLISAYIQSTYKISAFIALGIFALFSILLHICDIKSFLNIPLQTSFVTKLFLLNVFFFCTTFILNTHKALFVSVHKGKYAEQSIAVNQIIFLLSLAIPIFFFPSIRDESKLYLISFLNGTLCIFINIIYTCFFFKTNNFEIFKRIKTPKKHLSDIYRLGFKYMIIQTGTLFLFSSDNYILAYFFSPKEIVPYEIVSKYFQFPLMILMAGMAPLWSLFTKKYLEKNKNWLRNSFKRFNLLFVLILILLFVFTLCAPLIMKIWISHNFKVPSLLLISIALMTSLRIFTAFYSYFFNGVGNLRSYLLLLAFSVLLKIPLSYLFVKLNFGISSVVLSSTVCLFVWSIIQPIEAYKVVSSIKNHE